MIPIAQGRHGEVFAISLRPQRSPTPGPAISLIPSDGWVDEINGSVLNEDEALAGQHSVRLDSLILKEDWRAVKVVCAPKTGRSAYSTPHDVVKEVELLRRINHSGIIRLLHYKYDEDLLEHRLTFPLYATTLSRLLQDSAFPLHPDKQYSRSSIHDNVVYPQIICSLLSAVDYLHKKDPPIAHRDINPSNLLIDWDGTLKLGDFGTAWSLEKGRTGHGSRDDLPWKEDPEDMCCDVGTGPYRAPELLFSPRSYNALAIDLWAAGCTIAQLFTPYRSISSTLTTSDTGSESSLSSEEDYDPLEDEGFRPHRDVSYRAGSECVTSHLAASDGPGASIPSTDGTRKPLFDASFGSLGLAACIFKILGTPTSTSWPSFETLPDAGKIEFPFSPPTDLAEHLPGLHGTGTHAYAIKQIIAGLLVLEPSKRISAGEAIEMARQSGWADMPSDNDGEASREAREAMRRWIDPYKRRYEHVG
ncbi:hypothetical protein IAU59_002046 [Kwoniella sp. CBS 9459]